MLEHMYVLCFVFRVVIQQAQNERIVRLAWVELDLVKSVFDRRQQ